MDEYSRIIIEQYCMFHNNAKSKFLNGMVNMSYYLDSEPDDCDALKLE